MGPVLRHSEVVIIITHGILAAHSEELLTDTEQQLFEVAPLMKSVLKTIVMLIAGAEACGDRAKSAAAPENFKSEQNC